MKLRKWSLRGVTRFVEPLAIDLSGQSGIVCIVGENGAGKTTAVEAVVLALYGRLAWYPGAPFDHCRGRDAFVEVEFEAEDGRSIIVRRLIDAEARKQEAYLIIDGEAVTSGRVREIQPAIERLFGPADLFLASVFGDQRRAGSFLDAAPAERKALLAELLQLGELEQIAGAAREHRSMLERERSVERARIQEIGDALEQRNNSAEAVELAERDFELSAAAEARAAEDRAATERAATEAREAAAQYAALQAGAIEAERVAERDAHDLAAARQQSDAEQRAFDRRKAEAVAAIEAAERLGDAAHERHAAAIAALTDRKTRLEAEVARAPEVSTAKRVLAEEQANHEAAVRLQNERAAAIAALDAAEVADDRAEKALVAAEDRREQRMEELRQRGALLERVPCQGMDIAGTCPLLADARDAAATVLRMEAESEPYSAELALVQQTGAAVVAATDRLAEIDEQLAKLPALDEQRLAAAKSIAALEPVIQRAQVELMRLDGEKERADRALSDELKQAFEALARARDARDRVVAESEEAIAAGVARLTQASLRAEESREIARRQRESAQAAQAAAQRAEDLRRSAATAKAQHDRAVAEVARCREILAARRERLEAATVRAKRLEECLDRLEQIDSESADWALLERGFGREGIQALEIDSAGPEIARLTNELLAACYGPRFSVSLETLREKRAGGTAETLDVRIYDGATVRQHVSGGEQCIVEEALKLALSIYNARKSGIRWRTLWRDETVGPLDPENAERYVRMMRRALELGGFECAIVIAHSREVWESADARIVLEDGRARVAA